MGEQTQATAKIRRLSVVAAAVIGLVGAAVPAWADQPDGGIGPGSATAGVKRPDNGIFEVVGRGWGHGRGMSQWGAYAAAKSGQNYREILRFYYPRTTLVSDRTSDRLRVFLSHRGGEVRVRPEPGLTLWWTRRDGSTRPEALPTSLADCRVSTWRVRPIEGRAMAVEGYSCGAWRTFVPSRKILPSGRASFVAPDGTVAVERRTSDGTKVRRDYRGFLRVVLRDGRLRPINVVSYEEYLRSVVPAESPAGWPRAALRAQAVAARTYAVRSARDRGGASFDVYDTTASQAYPGRVRYNKDWKVTRTYEHARTDAAIAATAGQTLRYNTRDALTEFGSSNGGWTADGAKPYLRAQTDGWDANASDNPSRDWKDTVTASRLQRRYPSIGTLREIRVLERSGGGTWGGRVRALLLVGSAGSREIRGEDNVRWALGLRSAWFAFQD
ncbi:SpoIID/LytB domain-containing protein [Actinopolymorpha alba]|uniref:SpoIID/LytB domain-containing protein n=1 Tax=Actinopolymorpha alba TaxID=533267 RepID=UPI00037CF6BD|nr:SpoIID/LytB domain-containing protein [Actinopolymorpha alba]